MVGDIVDLQQGDRVPADCILVEEMNITVDEGIYNKEYNEPVEKEQSEYFGPQNETPDNHLDNPDPFLLTDTKIMTGQGKAVVCSVGENTLLARSRNPQDMKIDEQ